MYKELYDNIIHCNLNYNEEVESVLLSDAIRYSIETKGCLLNKKLKEKATEFGDDPHETYLRITLGQSRKVGLFQSTCQNKKFLNVINWKLKKYHTVTLF
jgi:hypothetical protein